MSLEWIYRLAEGAHLPPGFAISVTNTTGAAVVRYPNPEKWLGKEHPIMQPRIAVPGSREGIHETLGVDGVKRIYAISSITGEGELTMRVGKIPRCHCLAKPLGFFKLLEAMQKLETCWLILNPGEQKSS